MLDIGQLFLHRVMLVLSQVDFENSQTDYAGQSERHQQLHEGYAAAGPKSRYFGSEFHTILLDQLCSIT